MSPFPEDGDVASDHLLPDDPLSLRRIDEQIEDSDPLGVHAVDALLRRARGELEEAVVSVDDEENAYDPDFDELGGGD
ncbi:MAG: hypothetical protein G01um101425_753 [Candidatus Peregrinibacteria bacterium Gr01-1014_25]|nr:MAG: hypothetical protein G01um101425_753 [Candidatus Peregrinibacteria bacterium Gr01-1014_25]